MWSLISHKVLTLIPKSMNKRDVTTPQHPLACINIFHLSIQKHCLMLHGNVFQNAEHAKNFSSLIFYQMGHLWITEQQTLVLAGCFDDDIAWVIRNG